MRLTPGLLGVDDYKHALVGEAFATRALVPPNDDFWPLATKDGAAEWLSRRCSGEFAPIPGQIVTVRKSGHGVRPVAELSVRDRVLYRALVNRWKDTLPEPERSSESYQAFLEAPISIDPDPAYVVSSDITSYYEYIDHGLLAKEILARTGDSDGVEALTSLLAGIMGRSFGLPQQSGTSDTLAEVYLSVVQRRLLRRGLAVWRYNDDFRISVGSWSEALNSVDSLERECRAIGLALNDLKTIIRKGATYQDFINRRSQELQKISEVIEVDFTDVVQHRYEDILVEPDSDEVSIAAAHKVVKEWLSLQRAAMAPDPMPTLTSKEQERLLTLTDLLRWAIVLLTSEQTEDHVLEACGQILRTEQTLTPLVAKYLTEAKDRVATVEWFETFLASNPYLTPWQAWWVAPALREAVGSYADGSTQQAWLRSVWNDSACPEPVRAGIAVTVAQKGLEDVNGLMRTYESMTDTGRPFVARAIGAVALEGDPGAATLLIEDEWIKWAFEAEHRGP